MRESIPSGQLPASDRSTATALLRGMLALTDTVALLIVLPLPLALLLAPVLVHGDRIDLGFWLIDSSSEAWMAVVPGALAVLAILAASVRVAHTQQAWLQRHSPSQPASPAPTVAAGRDAEIATLTPRETEVLELMSSGLTNRAMAQRLFISEATVRKHVGRIFAKLDVDGDSHDRRVSAVLTYVRHARP